MISPSKKRRSASASPNYGASLDTKVSQARTAFAHFAEHPHAGLLHLRCRKKWKCHTGCGEGSVIDFLAKARGISEAEACLEILKRAGGNRENRQKRLWQDPYKRLPQAIPWNREIARRIADSRGLRITAVEFAALWLKTVVFARVCDHDCWILTDASQQCAEARRIDAKPFPAIGTLAERKSHSLRGSSKSWPVGILPLGFEEPWLHKHVHKILSSKAGQTISPRVNS